ncbi:MAG: ribosomal-processing cysteine protease Prp, partial [Clostridia bacterium]
MTKTVFLKRDGKFCGFSVSGHSGYADAGSDIICASVSSYVNMTVALLEKSGVAIDIKTDESIPS